MAKFITNTSGTNWWRNFPLIEVAQPKGRPNYVKLCLSSKAEQGFQRREQRQIWNLGLDFNDEEVVGHNYLQYCDIEYYHHNLIR